MSRVGPIVMSVAVIPGALFAQSVPPAPPVRPAGQVLVSWASEAVTCADGARPGFVAAPDPAPSIGYGFGDRVSALTATFRIGADGRPLDVARQGGDYVSDADDLLPALVAARFGGGQAHEQCSVRFVAVRQPVETAARELAQWYTVFPSAGSPPRAVWERARPGGSTCFDPGPAPLLRAYPDFKAIGGVPGRRSWSMVGFDLDAGGRPQAPQVVAGSALAPLDAAAIRAVAASRFEQGARSGCLYPYYRNAATLPAPPSPAAETLTPAGATCPRDLAYVRQPTLTFPEPYRRRSIEGWAVLAFDVAPWGAIGNVRVLAAQPAAEFGEWAKRVVAGATKATTNTGYVGCVDRVLFRMGERAELLVQDGPAIAASF